MVVTKELNKETHAWLRALSNKVQNEDALRVLHQIPGLNGVFEREMADSVLSVMLEANGKLVTNLKGDDIMYYDTLFKLLEPKLPMYMEAVIEKGRNEGIQGTVDILKELGHADSEIKDAIMGKYNLSSERADDFLKNPPVQHA